MDREYRGNVSQLPLYDWWRHPGISVNLGINGLGIDIAEAVRQRVNIRVGVEFLRYTGQYLEQGAQLGVDVRLGGGHAGLDIFPLQHSSFHISPQIRYGILTRGHGTVFVPPGQAVTFNDKVYVSSLTDPLTGDAMLSVRKTAPGVVVGFGNLVPRERRVHWTVPVELGFYYIGQPSLQVHFGGTSCDPNKTQPAGCDKVDEDDGFQSDLNRYLAHFRHSLSYASLYPVISYGVGYRF